MIVKAIILFIFCFITKAKTSNQKYYQEANLDSYEIQEESTSYNSTLQCCIYCSQGECCEGAIFDGNSCQLLQNVHLTTNSVLTKAWVNSEIVQRGTILDKVLIFTGEPANESLISELIDFRTQTSCQTKLIFPKPIKHAFGGKINEKVDTYACMHACWGIPQLEAGCA